MDRYWKILPLAVLGILIATIAVPAQESTNRPAHWAQKIEVAGIRNCYRVGPNLYRGAQPTREGMAQLKAMGIKTIVNLRAHHSDRDEMAGTGLKSVRFEMEPWHGDTEEVIRFLKVVADTNQVPVFVHCERGADRTGMMCAMYRIIVSGWTRPAAIDEMKNGGFGFSPVWHELIAFIEQADIADIKRRAGLAGK